MSKPWENNSCEHIRAYFGYYTVAQAAMLWCNVPVDQVNEMLQHAMPISTTSESGKSILRHPYIPCLEPRCRAIQDAIDRGKLKVGRDGGNTFFATHDHVAYSRRTLKRDDLKEWIASEFPNDKPAFLFDEIERKTHTAINADAYTALQADRDASKAELQNTIKRLEEVTIERDALKACIDKMTAAQAKQSTPSERAETTYLNIIGGLLNLMLSNSPAGKPQSVFQNQAAIISALLGHYGDKPGISDRTLEAKFAEANRSLSST